MIIPTKLTITLKPDDDFWNASVEEIKGCHTQGKTIKETLNRLSEALEVNGVNVNKPSKKV